MMLIEPAADIEELKRHWQTIQELKKSILDKSDIQEIQGRTYVKRSGWRKLQSAFAISDRIISKEREDQAEGHFLWRVEVEAYHAKTGRSAMGIGTCSTKERKFAHPDHDILATAHTRAKNRAISDLIGLGEVSAEELDATPDEHPKPSIAKQAPPKLQLSSDALKEPQNPMPELCKCGHRVDLHGGKKGTLEYTCIVGTKENKACVCA